MEPEGPIDPEDDGAPPHAATASDEGRDVHDAGEGFAPGGFEHWRRHTALGSVGTGIARGLQSVFAPPPNQPAVVASVPGDPPDPERLRVILDPDDPSKSVALLPSADEPGRPGADEQPD